MNEESKFVNFRKRKPASDEEKSRDRAMHRVVNLPEHRVVQERARHRVENLPEQRVVEERARHRVANLPEHRLVEVRDADRARHRVANLPEQRVVEVRNADRSRARVRAEVKRSGDQEWDYLNLCQYCKCLYLKSEKSRKMCCRDGTWFGINSPFPKLEPLPDVIRFYAFERREHFASRSSFYNGLYSLVITGVDNGREGVGFEQMNMESCVKLNGRIYHW